MATSWWRPLTAEPRLSQGDILADATFALPAHPRQPLVKHTFGGGAVGWKDSAWTEDASGFCHLLGRGRVVAAIVVTHGCQLDKKEKKGRVTLAPVAQIANAKEEDRDNIMAGLRIALAPLPGIDGLGDCYADLRGMVAFDRKVIDQLTRVATMTRPAMADFRERVGVFFVRPGNAESDDICQLPGAYGGVCDKDHEEEVVVSKDQIFPRCSKPNCNGTVGWVLQKPQTT
jgi:hypothetical protein